MNRIELIPGDITTLDVDAIVNAANKSLLGGGGVDGAIHHAAGISMLDECKKLGGCNTGEAKITGGHNLKARYVIHTVGPVWKGGTGGEEQLLALCYRNSLRIAAEKKLESIAFPNISTGIYGYPKQEAAIIAFREVLTFMQFNQIPARIIFICHDEENYRIYKQLVG